MKNALLYTSVCLIWSMFWIILRFQAGLVSPLWNAAYRYAPAALLLFVICLLARKPLRFNKTQHKLFALQGLFLFCLNGIFYYISAKYVISGIMALMAAFMPIMNAVNARIIFKKSITLKVIAGSLLGVIGLIFIFISISNGENLPEKSMISMIFGTLAALAGTYAASLGAMASMKSQTEQKIPLLSINAYSMLYGTFFIVLIAFITGEKITFPASLSFVASLFYISILGTVVAFQFYLTLIKDIGPERAAYVYVIIPIMAMIVSMIFENVHLHFLTFLGIGIASFGNIIVVSKKLRIPKLSFANKKTLPEINLDQVKN